jgi:hypothetical protein
MTASKLVATQTKATIVGCQQFLRVNNARAMQAEL